MTRLTLGIGIAALAWCACGKQPDPPAATAVAAAPVAIARPARPPLDPTNIVSIAIASKDHATLVAALEAADYVTAAAASGPLTVFAPTDGAFGKLPAGTVESLVKPENQAKLKEILKYHVTTSALDIKDLKDGEPLAMANGAKTMIRITDGKMMVNDANVIATVRASNGIVHVIDAVLLPPVPTP